MGAKFSKWRNDHPILYWVMAILIPFTAVFVIGVVIIILVMKSQERSILHKTEQQQYTLRHDIHQDIEASKGILRRESTQQRNVTMAQLRHESVPYQRQQVNIRMEQFYTSLLRGYLTARMRRTLPEKHRLLREMIQNHITTIIAIFQEAHMFYALGSPIIRKLRQTQQALMAIQIVDTDLSYDNATIVLQQISTM